MVQEITKSILAIASVAFILLGILFGMNIMTFIFGGVEGANIFPQNSNSTLNETGYINVTNPFQVSHASVLGFDNFVVTSAINTTSGAIIASTNYTTNDIGVVTGTGFTNWTSVQFNYTFTSGGNSQAISSDVTSNSLTAINTYSQGANTQFSTLSTIIILLLLIAIFAVFWSFFTGGFVKNNGKITGGESFG